MAPACASGQRHENSRHSDLVRQAHVRFAKSSALLGRDSMPDFPFSLLKLLDRPCRPTNDSSEAFSGQFPVRHAMTKLGRTVLPRIVRSTVALTMLVAYGVTTQCCCSAIAAGQNVECCEQSIGSRCCSTTDEADAPSSCCHRSEWISQSAGCPPQCSCETYIVVNDVSAVRPPSHEQKLKSCGFVATGPAIEYSACGVNSRNSRLTDPVDRDMSSHNGRQAMLCVWRN